jgi:hypothetical protein
MFDRKATDYSLLIPDLPNWNNGNGIDVDGWLGYMGKFQLMIAFSQLFWPDFVELDGCVFRYEVDPGNYDAWLNTTKGNKASVEAVINHRHILDLFYPARDSATAAQLIYIGRVLKEILTVKLQHDFPTRVFTVAIDEGPFDDLVEYQVTFWQPANEPKT